MNTSQNTPANAPQVLDVTPFRWEGHMSDGIGATYGPEPMAFLSATATELVLSGPRGTFHLARAHVVKLGRGRMYPWFFAGIRIHHKAPKYPDELQFKPLGALTRDIFAQLRSLGYPVA